MYKSHRIYRVLFILMWGVAVFAWNVPEASAQEVFMILPPVQEPVNMAEGQHLFVGQRLIVGPTGLVILAYYSRSDHPGARCTAYMTISGPGDYYVPATPDIPPNCRMGADWRIVVDSLRRGSQGFHAWVTFYDAGKVDTGGFPPHVKDSMDEHSDFWHALGR